MRTCSKATSSAKLIQLTATTTTTATITTISTTTRNTIVTATITVPNHSYHISNKCKTATINSRATFWNGKETNDRAISAFAENTSTSPSLVKEYTYNCPWCKYPSNPKIGAIWPIPTYKPVSWDKYYIDDVYRNRTTVGSGIAAGLTIGLFFVVFLVTFGCRMFNARVERLQREQAERAIRSTIINPENMLSTVWVCGVPHDPPPPYEVAITMPRCNTSPPPIPSTESTCSTESNLPTQYS